ncbi:MAG: hypothetical protein HC858_03505 [Brachymonas sp.]|nr:hypothetical protein [Brachymonas sp.]NJS37465.1 hypothetical protein [Brachymonas sp.]
MLSKMRIVGSSSRYNELPSPQEAWRRGLALDLAVKRMQPALDSRSEPPLPRVQRLSHSQMNAQDDARMLERARLINTTRQQRGGTG